MSPLRREYECVAESADGIGDNHDASASLVLPMGALNRD